MLDSKPDDGGYGKEAKGKLEYLLRATKLPKFLEMVVLLGLPNNHVVKGGQGGSYPRLSIRKHAENQLEDMLFAGQFFEASDP